MLLQCACLLDECLRIVIERLGYQGHCAYGWPVSSKTLKCHSLARILASFAESRTPRPHRDVATMYPKYFVKN